MVNALDWLILKVMNEKESTSRGAGLRDLYPHLNEDDLKKAEEAFDRYLEVVLRIYGHLEENPEAHARFKALTGSVRNPKMENKRSKPLSDSPKQ